MKLLERRGGTYRLGYVYKNEGHINLYKYKSIYKMRLNTETFELLYGKLCKGKLKSNTSYTMFEKVLAQIEKIQGDKLNCYYCVLGDACGSICADVLLLVKLDTAPGFKPIIIKNTVPCAINSCMEYMDYFNEASRHEYTITDSQIWNINEIMVHINDVYKEKFYEFMVKKYNIKIDEVLLFG